MTENERSPENVVATPAGPRIDPTLAHDLSNILAAAIASARLLRQKAESEDATQLSEIVIRQLERATTEIRGASGRARAK